MKKISKTKYRNRLNEDPMPFDMERINCLFSGEYGHAFCGWCDECDLPRFWCGHEAPHIEFPRHG